MTEKFLGDQTMLEVDGSLAVARSSSLRSFPFQQDVVGDCRLSRLVKDIEARSKDIMECCVS
jgi:hypothetical protein